MDCLQIGKEITQDGGQIVRRVVKCFDKKAALRGARPRLASYHSAGVSEKEACRLREVRHRICRHEILRLRPVVATEALHTGQEVRHMRPQGASAQMGIYKNYGTQILEERPPAGMIRQNTSVEHLRCRQ